MTRLRDFFTSRYRSYRRTWFWWRTGRTDHEALEHPRENLRKSATVYRIYQRLHRENSIIGEEIPSYFVREREVRRKEALTDHNHLDWLNRAGQRWVMLYGESPWRVVYTSVTVVVLFAILFPLLGGVSVETDPPTHWFLHPVMFPGSIPEPVGVLFISLYFSAVTFTTLGYGGMQPSSSATQFLAATESLIGAMLIAFLVAVLARRVMR